MSKYMGYNIIDKFITIYIFTMSNQVNIKLLTYKCLHSYSKQRYIMSNFLLYSKSTNILSN